MAYSRHSGSMPSSAATCSICSRFRRHSSDVGPAGGFQLGSLCPVPATLARHGLFPQQPHLARALGEQVFSGKAHLLGEAFGAFSHQHHVAGVVHDGAGQERDVLDVLHRAHRSGAPRRTVHARGIQFDHAIFVRQPAETNGLVIGVIFLRLADQGDSVESIAAAAQQVVGRIERVQPGGLRD